MANRHGDFIWYELMTPDAKASAEFYAPLLGWTIRGDPEYAEISGSDGGVGGMLHLTPDMIAGGARPCWVGYVLVDDVDAMVASVEHGGGKVYLPARDMPGIGRFAMLANPQGAAFHIMKPTSPANDPDATSHAFSYDRPRIGHCAWNELASSDPAAALQFYGQRFGWVKDGEMEMEPMGTYEFLRHTGRAPDGSPPGHGMIGAVMPKIPVSAWTYYFRVLDVDVAVAAITANGGSIVRPPIEIPGGDFSLVGVDPQGATFALVGGKSGTQA